MIGKTIFLVVYVAIKAAGRNLRPTGDPVDKLDFEQWLRDGSAVWRQLREML